MKTIKELNIKDWSGYFFRELINILDIEPEYFTINHFKGRKDDSTIFDICYCEEGCVSHVVFNNIECIFRKSGMYSYLIFCESDKSKKMLDNYVSIIDQLKEEISSFEEEFEEDHFVIGSCFMRFKFRTDDNLV